MQTGLVRPALDGTSSPTAVRGETGEVHQL